MEGIKKDHKKATHGIGRNAPHRLRQILRWIVGILTAGFLAFLMMFLVINKYPAAGATGADWLRSVVGDKAVAVLEMMVFQLQDKYQMLKYQLGMEAPAEEWGFIPSASASPTFSAGTNTESQLSITPTPAITGTIQPTITSIIPWQPAVISTLTQTNGEGIWIPYLQDAQGKTIGFKTIVHPDPDRPYTLTAIVGVDLMQARLHYVLGSLEPSLPGTPERPGVMPEADRSGTILLAAFNGGFQARHGRFGAMADGIQALPVRDGLGTIVIYKDGEVQIGKWGSDLGFSKEIEAFRQNGPLVIEKGQINPQIYNNSPEDWGHTVDDVSPTARSGIGLSKDNHTLYYFSGYSLTMEGLAKSMQMAGIYNAIQLDINYYWVLFVKITPSGSKLVSEPLVPWEMVADLDRFIKKSPRDFFYITSLIKE